MPDPKTEHALLQVIAIATTSAQLSAATALILQRRGALQPPEAEHLAMLTRHLGELFEEYGDDAIAGDFAAIAGLLRGASSSDGQA